MMINPAFLGKGFGLRHAALLTSHRLFQINSPPWFFWLSSSQVLNVNNRHTAQMSGHYVVSTKYMVYFGASHAVLNAAPKENNT